MVVIQFLTKWVASDIASNPRNARFNGTIINIPNGTDVYGILDFFLPFTL